MPRTASTFRINAKNYFLTYAQCDVTKEDMRDHILGLEGDRIAWMVLASEKHADGGDHLHIQIEYENSRQIYKADHFDKGEFHPNITGTRNLKKVFFYFFYLGFRTNYYRLGSTSLRMGTISCMGVQRRSSVRSWQDRKLSLSTLKSSSARPTRRHVKW